MAAGIYPREARPSGATQQGALHRPTGSYQNLGPPRQQKPSLGCERFLDFLHLSGSKKDKLKVSISL
jgi:hypothetical protein